MQITISLWALHSILNSITQKKPSVFFNQNPGEAHMTLEQLQCLAKICTWQSFMTKVFPYVLIYHWKFRQLALGCRRFKKQQCKAASTLIHVSRQEFHKLFCCKYVEILTPQETRRLLFTTVLYPTTQIKTIFIIGWIVSKLMANCPGRIIWHSH